MYALFTTLFRSQKCVCVCVCVCVCLCVCVSVCLSVCLLCYSSSFRQGRLFAMSTCSTVPRYGHCMHTLICMTVHMETGHELGNKICQFLCDVTNTALCLLLYQFWATNLLCWDTALFFCYTLLVIQCGNGNFYAESNFSNHALCIRSQLWQFLGEVMHRLFFNPTM